MPLSPGTTLGPYAVTAKIGEGGMGEVYQARDTKLDRDVALKVLPQAFTDDPDRLARFEREAKVLASLNHPNIGGIHGLEESDDIRALVLEYIAGPTLADRIKQGPIPVDEALPIAKQIAEALEAAHEAGVIHRDLKPANIKVRDDGTVKVLDFGLAKALDPTPQGDPSQSPTLTAAATQMGVIMGTAAYMSPEQARGKPVDKRADIWAFGAVLYEMLTGKRAFVGEDVSDTLAAVLRAEVELDRLPSEIPARLRRVITACLQRDPKERVHDMADVRLAMEGAFETPRVGTTSTAAVASRPQVLGSPVALLLGALAVAVVTGVVVWGLRSSPAPGPARRFVIPVSSADTGEFRRSIVAVSPDGETLIYVSDRDGVSQLFQHRLGELQGVPVPGTEGGNTPVFSPDGEWVAFTAAGSLKKVALAGGVPITLYEGETGFCKGVDGIAWGDNDVLVYGLNGTCGGLMQVSAAGGDPRPITTLDPNTGETDHRWPELLPGGEALLYTVWSGAAAGGSGQVAVQPLDGGERDLLTSGTFPRYLSSGHIVFVPNDLGPSLRAIPFNLAALEVTGESVPVVMDVEVVSNGLGQFAVSDNGTLLYVPARSPVGTRLVWKNRAGGEEIVPVAPAQFLHAPDISQDGTRMAVTVADTTTSNIWVYDLVRGLRLPITREPEADFYALLSPDGRRVVFGTEDVAGARNLFSRAADGTGEIEQLTHGPTTKSPWTWADQGRTLVFHDLSPDTSWDIHVLSMDGSRRSEPLLREEFAERSPAVSPDNQWIAYASSESGESEVYVRPYPNVETRRWLIGGGRNPLWAPHSRELFYETGERIMRVEIETEPSFQPGPPEELFAYPDPFNRGVPGFRVSHDGRFLVGQRTESTDQSESFPHLVVVLNWDQELLERVPID